MDSIGLVSLQEAQDLKNSARELVALGETGQACFHLALAALTFRHLGQASEALHSDVLLAWAQDQDLRPWQAVRTMASAMVDPGFESLPRWVKARAHLCFARSSWWLGDLSASSEHATKAYALASDPLERGRAALAVAQVAQHLGQRRKAACQGTVVFRKHF